MSHRDSNREPLIIDTVIQHKSRDWNDSTRTVARTDALRVLESLVAEYGVEASVRALSAQGFRGEAYRYLLTPLHAEAVSRRQRAARSAHSTE